MTTHTELFTWACEQCHGTGNEGRLTRKDASSDAQEHLMVHLKEALKRAAMGTKEKQQVGKVRVIPLPSPTNSRLL